MITAIIKLCMYKMKIINSESQGKRKYSINYFLCVDTVYAYFSKVT